VQQGSRDGAVYHDAPPAVNLRFRILSPVQVKSPPACVISQQEGLATGARNRKTAPPFSPSNPNQPHRHAEDQESHQQP
jgi:hypothetical protein